ncbi:MAG: hypothetical protein OXG26_18675 [Caldilineaceae bacterium]|nr:hypothetical protein [Caldilineaceae bacterium]MDE0634181.1 hypothetical protein [Caldilineaceae bacterium]
MEDKENQSQADRFPRNLFIDCSIAVPYFFLGVASILDFRGVLLDQHRGNPSEYKKDIAALRDDWNVIGQDMYRVIDTFLDSENLRDLRHE